MVIPELKNLLSVDLEYGKFPVDPEDCEIYCQADIGPMGMDAADIFFLIVVTSKHLAKMSGNRWGKGYLIVESFSWQIVENAIEKLLSHCSGTDWTDVANKLKRLLDWEWDLENYPKAFDG